MHRNTLPLLLATLLSLTSAHAQGQGFRIPERFKTQLAAFDKNGDGILNGSEIDTLPPRLRDRLKGRTGTRSGDAASGKVKMPSAPTGSVTPPSVTAFERAAQYNAAAGGQSFVVMQDGKIVFERYTNGGAVTREQGLASGSKSFNGVVAACAVQDGLILWDEKAADTLTEWKSDPRKSRITLRQLLHQTDGVKAGEIGRAGQSSGWAEAVNAPALAEPGASFVYGPNHFASFGSVLERKLKAKNPADSYEMYLKRRVLEPLGIKVSWQRAGDGRPLLAGGANMTARDWMTFGEFMRNEGIHNGKRIVEAKYLREIVKGDDKNPAYGLSWWLKEPISENLRRTIPILAGDMGEIANSKWLPEDLYMAAGAGKQRLYIIPSLKMVVERQGPVRGGRNFHDVEFLANLLRAEKQP